MAATALCGVAVVGCGADETDPTGPAVEIAVAPLELPGISNTVYEVTVKNESGEVVWSRQVDADGFGDGAGGVALVGPCDADDDLDGDGDATNSVELVLLSLIGTSGPLTPGADFMNPATAGAPLVRSATCRPNADASVTFDLTVARLASQGFFDVAVSFSDVFCSAKLDCDNPLLFHDGVRDETVVLALACTGGPGSDTHLYMDAIDVDCGTSGAVTIVPTSPRGNKGPLAPFVYQHAVYFGVEQLDDGAGSLAKAYWNVAIGVDEAALDPGVACTLSASATASPERFDTGTAPGTIWPEIVWDVTLKTAGSPALTCTSYALGAAGGDVAVQYRSGETYPYELIADISGGGAGATAGESGATTPPSWVTGPDLGTLAYGTSLSVALEADDLEGGVTYSSPDLPAYLSLDPATGALTGGTLSEADFGPTTFEVIASDGVFSVSRTFDLLVQHPGDCDDIKRANGAEAGYTVREVDPVGDGADVFQVLCDMDTWGGGWTLVTAQWEADPVDWAEGRQADYDASLVTEASFALTGADLPSHDQLAFGRAESTGPGTFDAELMDYVAHTYAPSATYDTTVTGLATTLPYHMDRDPSSYHGAHDPDRVPGSDPAWNGTLAFDVVGVRDHTWAYSPNHPSAAQRGYNYGRSIRGGDSDSFAWAVWVRDSAGIDAPPAAPPTSCAGYSGLTGVRVMPIDPTGANPLTALCDFDAFGGGWTLVVIQYEARPIPWTQGRTLDYVPSQGGTALSFALTGADLPAHSEVAFGRLQSVGGTTYPTNDKIDYVSFVYNPGANYGEVLRAGKATTNSYHIDRHSNLYHGNHDPESGTGNLAVWNNTLTFDRTGGTHFTWSFSPYQTTQNYRGYGYLGGRSGSSDAWGWAVWVR